jgi:hypothetical protein
MTMQRTNIESVSIFSDRKVKQLRKDAKRLKRNLNISLQDAMDLTLKKQGVTATWQRFITRATELFGSVTKTPYLPPLAKSTLFIGSTGSYMSRLASRQWYRMLSKEQQVIDVFIDAHGDALTYTMLKSNINQIHGLRKLNLFSFHRADDDQLVSQLFSSHESTLRCITSALFTDLNDRFMAMTHLQGGENAPPHVLERLNNSRHIGLLSWLDGVIGDKGFPPTRAIPFCGTTLFLLPVLVKTDPEYRIILADTLRLCLEVASLDEHVTLPMRITLTGLSGREDIPKELMHDLMMDPNIEIIIQCEPDASSDWLNTAVTLAEQTFISKVDECAVPAPLQCVSSNLVTLPRSENGVTPIKMFSKGKYIDLNISLSCDALYLSDNPKSPNHSNGKSITDRD